MDASSFQLTFDSSDSILLDPAIHNDPALLVSQFQLQQPLGFLDLFNYIAPDPNLGNPGGNNNPFANPDQAPVFVLDHFMLDQITGNPGAIPRDYAIVAIEQFDPASGLYNNQIILEPVTQNGTMDASSFQLTFDSSDSILLDPAIHNDPALLVSQFQLQQPLGFLDLFNYIAPDPNLGNPGGNNNPFANPDQAPVFVLDHFMLDQITGNPGAIPRDYAIVAIEQFDPASGLYNNQIILEPVTQNGTMGASSFQLTFDSSDSILLDPAIHNDPALLVSQFQLQQPLGFLDLFNYIAPDPNLGNPGGNNNPFANPDQAPVFVLDHFMLDQITGNPAVPYLVIMRSLQSSNLTVCILTRSFLNLSHRMEPWVRAHSNSHLIPVIPSSLILQSTMIRHCLFPSFNYSNLSDSWIYLITSPPILTWGRSK